MVITLFIAMIIGVNAFATKNQPTVTGKVVGVSLKHSDHKNDPYRIWYEPTRALYRALDIFVVLYVIAVIDDDSHRIWMMKQ
jgi:hypothetical protein